MLQFNGKGQDARMQGARMQGGGNIKKGLVNSWNWALIPAGLLPTSALLYPFSQRPYAQVQWLP